MHIELGLNYEIVQWSLDFVYFETLNIKLDLLISMKFVLVKVIKLELPVNYYFRIIDLGLSHIEYLLGNLEINLISLYIAFGVIIIRLEKLL